MKLLNNLMPIYRQQGTILGRIQFFEQFSFFNICDPCNISLMGCGYSLGNISLMEIFSFPSSSYSVCRGRFFTRSHVSLVGGVTLLDSDLFWGVQFGTRHWAA